MNNLEQYQRRTSLRIHGVPVPDGPETNQEVIKHVEETHKALKIPFVRENIFRAHRIGQKKTIDVDIDPNDKRKGVKKVKTQAVICKFTSWDARCALYKARPTRKKPVNNKCFTSISLDLEKNRLALLDVARSKITDLDLNTNEVYAFADINCNLVVRHGHNNFKYFNNKNQLERILEDIQS